MFLTVFFGFIILNSLSSNTFLNFYYYKHDSFLDTKQKNYTSTFYRKQKEYFLKGKEAVFFLLEFKLPEDEENHRNAFNTYIDFLENVPFDFSNFIDEDFLIQKYEDIVKRKKEKLICFTCREGSSYLYQKYSIEFFENLKLVFLHIPSCSFHIKKLEKFLQMHEDTNLWIFTLNENCIEWFSNSGILPKAPKIFFLRGDRQDFFKINDMYVCYVDRTFCYVRMKFREGELLNVENQFLKIF